MLDNIKNLPKLYKKLWERRNIPAELLTYSKPIYIYGKSGVGKTCLSISLLSNLSARKDIFGKSVTPKYLYISYPQLMYEEFSSRTAILKTFPQYDGILLDDFVPDNSTNNLFFIIVDLCYTKEIPLFITSNYDYKLFDAQPHIARRLQPYILKKEIQ